MVIDAYRRTRRFVRQIAGRDLWCRPQVKCGSDSLGVREPVYRVIPDLLDETSVIYSFGVGEDVSFDLAVIERFGACVHAFDPTPRSLRWVKSRNLSERFVFHEYGVADYDGVMRFQPPKNPNHVSYTCVQRASENAGDVDAPVRRIGSIMGELGHTRIDLLKMDVEGAEYGVIADLVGTGIDVRQLAVEFHHRWPEVGVSKTRDAIRLLNRYGMKLFHVSPTGEEMSFVQSRG